MLFYQHVLFLYIQVGTEVTILFIYLFLKKIICKCLHSIILTSQLLLSLPTYLPTDIHTLSQDE